MGIFISSPALAASALPAAASADAPALLRPPTAAPSVPDRPLSSRGVSGAAKPVDVSTRSAELQVYWGRLVFAFVVLLVILVGGFTAAILNLENWSTLLIHSFELLLGIFIGLLGGDIASRRPS